MSFKEDFFEALRSVKRDFLRDSEYNTPTSEQEREKKPPHISKPAQHPPEASAQAVAGGDDVNRDNNSASSAIGDSGDFRMPDNIYTPDDDPARSDKAVMDAFQQASAIDDNDGDLSDGDDDISYDYSSLHSSMSSDEIPPYRDYEPNFPDLTEQPVSADGRKIYDFDPDDFYSDDKTVISKNTVIRGALQTDDSVRLLGQILGDIDCKSNIVVAGKIRGNTSAANAYIVDAQIDGNMVCDDAVNVNKDAWILGNIRAQQAEIDGKIKGNIEIRHTVSIGSASSVIGNISTDELEVKRGAFVNGQIIMYSPSRDVIDRFDDFDRS